VHLAKACLLTFVGIALSSSWVARADTPAPTAATVKYELPRIPDEFKDADAIILSWDQKWTVAPDGAITQHEKKRVLIKHDRAIGAFADPRITYNKDWQTVKVLVARTITPDGRAMDIPEYSRNTVAPGECAGWPAFAAIQQLVLTYSAIEPGAILELEWERVTKPGMKASLEIDERVETEFPCLVRSFAVNDANPTSCRVENVLAVRDEPQAWTADEGCRWFVYPASRDQAWIASLLGRLDDDAKKSDLLSARVQEWTKGKTGHSELIQTIHAKLREAVTVVHASPAYLPDSPRASDEVLLSRYATPRECAALFTALCREAGLSVKPFVMIVRRSNMQQPGQPPFYGRVAPEYSGVVISTSDTETYWNAERGRIFVDSACDPRRLCFLKDGKVESPQPTLYKFGEPIPGSRIDIAGTIQIASDGKWTGRFSIDATRAFRRGKDLQTENERKQFAAGMLERVVPDITVKSVSVRSLSDDRIELSAEVHSNAAVPSVDGHRMLQLAAEGPWTRDVPIPLRTSKRERPMRIADVFVQTLKVTIESPKDWSLTTTPRTIGSSEKDNAGAYQRVDSSEGKVILEQRVSVPSCLILANDYPRLRTALSELQTNSARTFIWKAPADAVQKVN